MPLLTARLVVLSDTGDSVVLHEAISYEFNNDIFAASDSFRMVVPLVGFNSKLSIREVKKILGIVKEEAVVRLELGDDRVLSSTGIIGTVVPKGSRGGGLVLEVSGRDAMQVFTDSTVQPGFTMSDSTLPQLVDKLAERYRGKGIRMNVISDNAANRNVMSGKRYGEKRFHDYKSSTIRTSQGDVASRPMQQPDTFVHLPFDEAKPNEGETEYRFITRHCENLGVMFWATCQGDFFLGVPADGQAPIYKLQRRFPGVGVDTRQNNILDNGLVRRSSEGRWTKVTCLGHKEGRGEYKTQVKAVVEAPAGSYKWPREHIVRDAHAKDSSRAQKIAQRTFGRSNTNRAAAEYPVQGFGINGLYYVPDTVAEVNDEWAAAKGNYYITGRTVSGNRDTGENTMLRLVPVGTITL